MKFKPMLIDLNELHGYKIHASDGLLGKAKDFFFSDYCWKIRYLVVDTGWLFGRRILVAPAAIKEVDIVDRRITLSISREEFEQGPGIETDLPVSRQTEIALSQHYGWPKFWEEHPGAGVIAPAKALMQPRGGGQEAADCSTPAAILENTNPHLRSAREVQGYHIEATDGEIGHVDDLIVDDETWTIHNIVVDTSNWMPGRRVIIAPSWATEIDRHDQLIRVSIDCKALNNCPLREPITPTRRDQRAALDERPGRETYRTH